ncbi:hypothetical protein PanWU01x14_017860 [Parasponia andersonii]|uniref:Uncharacterized protein n=1 Tax=Parasponia andersonii TaxID=3476 RepID=A0A2P5DZ09_PARAD|nr:hypothetical protein PanWU01x14_017860 [Parasponia andersonii]
MKCLSIGKTALVKDSIVTRLSSLLLHLSLDFVLLVTWRHVRGSSRLSLVKPLKQHQENGLTQLIHMHGDIVMSMEPRALVLRMTVTAHPLNGHALPAKNIIAEDLSNSLTTTITGLPVKLLD